MVSAEGTAVFTASKLFKACKQLVMVWVSISGRTASWIIILEFVVEIVFKASCTVSLLVFPPSKILDILENWLLCNICLAFSKKTFSSITIISSIFSCFSKAVIECSKLVKPAIGISCLGISKPTRLPTPPATIMAIVFSFKKILTI